jgi:hypothetical protein
MWWNIDRGLLCGGKNMNVDSINGITMEMNSHGQTVFQSQAQLAAFDFWSHTTSQFSTKTMNAKQLGFAHPTSQCQSQKVMVSQSIMVSDFLTSDWGRLHDNDE